MPSTQFHLQISLYVIVYLSCNVKVEQLQINWEIKDNVTVEICALCIPLRVHCPYGNNCKELFLIMQSLRFH